MTEIEAVFCFEKQWKTKAYKDMKPNDSYFI